MQETENDKTALDFIWQIGRSIRQWLKDRRIEYKVRKATHLSVDTEEALTQILIQTPQSWQEVAKLLFHSNSEIRRHALGAIENAAREGRDLTPAIPRLLEAPVERIYLEKDLGYWTRTETLQWLARYGHDITAAEETLDADLESRDSGVSLAAAQALTYHYWNRNRMDGICVLVERDFPTWWWTSMGAAQALEEGVMEGRSIVPILPVIVRMLEGGNWTMEYSAMRILMALEPFERVLEAETALERYGKEGGNARTLLTQRKAELAEEMGGQMPIGHMQGGQNLGRMIRYSSLLHTPPTQRRRMPH